MKKEIKPLVGALDKMLSLNGVTFKWINPEEQGNFKERMMGLIAQDVEQVFPTWITTNCNGYKDLTVIGFEALTVEAMRELKNENEKLKEMIESMNKRIKVLENK